MSPVDEIFRLDLVAGARHEATAEVREPVRPEAGLPELWRGVDGVGAGDRVTLDGGSGRTEQFALDLGAALQPDLIDVVGPEREDAHAVGCSGDRVELLEQHVPAQVLEHALADFVRRFDVERDARHGAE